MIHQPFPMVPKDLDPAKHKAKAVENHHGSLWSSRGRISCLHQQADGGLPVLAFPVQHGHCASWLEESR